VEADALAHGVGIHRARRNGKMLPGARQVGEAQIDHLDVLVLDGLEDILGSAAIKKHGSSPPFRTASRLTSGAADHVARQPRRHRSGGRKPSPADRDVHLRTKILLPPRQLSFGPRISRKAFSTRRQFWASSLLPCSSQEQAIWAASTSALSPWASNNCRA